MFLFPGLLERDDPVDRCLHGEESSRRRDMSRVFISWDNLNIFHEAQRFAEERNEGPDARYRVRVNFDNILRLAHADRTLAGGGGSRVDTAGDATAMESDGGCGSRSPALRPWKPGAERRIRPTEYCSYACLKMLSTTTATPAASSC